MRIHSVLVAVLLAVPARAAAQATHVSEPADDYLLDITREWESASPLGDPRARRMAAGDVELRFWGGYGVAGTRGFVLRRTGGRWSAWRALARTCHIDVPITGERDETGGSALSPKELARYRAEARRRCGEPRAELTGPTRAFDVDTLDLVPLDEANLAAAWDAAVAEGVLRLPPRIPRATLIEDGHSYVVEVRRGDSYRASVIRHVDPPETADDRRVRRVAAVLDKQFGAWTTATHP